MLYPLSYEGEGGDAENVAETALTCINSPFGVPVYRAERGG